MRPFRFSFIALPLIVAIAGAQQPLASLNGVVLEAGTDKPMARVSLELRPFVSSVPPGTPPPPPSAPVTEPRYPSLTNDNGQFVFRNIPPGSYALIASRNGYVHAEYGQRGPNGKGMPLNVAAGQLMANIRLSMTPAAAISGHVLNIKGDPFPYVQMHARRLTYPDGQRTLTIVGSTYTDDQGAYRIYGLPPGLYVLAAEGEASGQSILPVAASLAPPLPGSVVIQGISGGMFYTADPANQRKSGPRIDGGGSPVYFRNALNDRDASLIELRPGDDLTGTDIVFTATPKVPVTISAAGASNVAQVIISPGPTTIRGSFQNGPLRAPLAPGSYVAVALTTDSSNKPVVGYNTFNVSPSNPSNVNLSLNAPIPVTGRIVLEGGSVGVNDADLAKIGILFRPNPPIPGLPDSGIQRSGAAVFSSSFLVSGDYTARISLPDTLGDRFVKSGTNMRAAGPAVNDFQIVLAAGAGHIQGVASGGTGAPMANVSVVLVPEQRNRIDLYKSFVTDPAGRFRFDSITPGRYLLFAWEDVETDAWLNPEFIRALEDRGKPVTIVEGSRETLNAVVIPIR